MSGTVVFACGRANVSRSELPPNVRFTELACAGRVSVPLLLATLARGADGILVLGRHQETCRLRGAEDPARENVRRADELAGLAGLGRGRVRFVQPPPGLDGSRVAIGDFVRAIQRLGPRPSVPPPAPEMSGPEGLDTSLALLAWFANHAASLDGSAWLKGHCLPSPVVGKPVLVADVLPYLDLLGPERFRPTSFPDVVRTAIALLSGLGIADVGVEVGPWANGTRAEPQTLRRAPAVYVLSAQGKGARATAGVKTVGLDDLVLQQRARFLPPPVRAAVACDASSGERLLVEALGYDPVDVGPDPLPDRFAFSPDDRRRADARLRTADGHGAAAMLVSDPLSLARWAMLTRHGTWRSSRVLPVMPHALAWLSLSRMSLSSRSIENPFAAAPREISP